MKFIFFSILLGTLQLYSQERNIPISANSGLSSFQNPAFISEHKTTLTSAVANRYWTGLNEFHLALNCSKKNRSVSVGLSTLPLFDYYFSNIYISYSMRIDSTTQIGVTSGLKTTNLTGKDAYAFEGKLGIQKNWQNGISLISNLGIGNRLVYETKTNYNLSFNLNLSYSSNQTTVSLESRYLDRWFYSTWLAYDIVQNINFFVGLNFEPTSYTAGIRCTSGRMNILISFNYHPSLGTSPFLLAEYAH